MAFSEKMKSSLGAEGASVEIEPLAETFARPGAVRARLRVRGGTRDATVEGFMVRLVVGQRSWTDASGKSLPDAERRPRSERKGLSPVWSHRVAREIAVGDTVEIPAGGEYALEFEIPIPEGCGPSSASCAVTLNVQADIKGQIDPTGNVRVDIG